MPRRDALAAVELVEDDELDPREPAAPTGRRRRRWWWLVAPAAVLAVAFAGQQAIDARARAADARIAALPGAVAPVGDRLEVLWHTDPADASLAWGPSSLGAVHGVVTQAD